MLLLHLSNRPKPYFGYNTVCMNIKKMVLFHFVVFAHLGLTPQRLDTIFHFSVDFVNTSLRWVGLSKHGCGLIKAKAKPGMRMWLFVRRDKVCSKDACKLHNPILTKAEFQHYKTDNGRP